jgi:hypothetical protein
MEHINRVLDVMLANDPRKRLSIWDTISFVKEATRLFEKEYNPVSSIIPQVCTYCGIGIYQMIAKEPGEAENFGLNPRGGSHSHDWRILNCQVCGHVQIFKIDKVKRKDWWQEHEKA